uniref:Uncharacterized protein n=1 Tax=Cucumis melo TaxID=3656 RepID=A0A9I9DS42_CUCME
MENDRAVHNWKREVRRWLLHTRGAVRYTDLIQGHRRHRFLAGKEGVATS